MALKELQFTDIYLGEKDSFLAGVPGTLDPVPAPDAVSLELMALRQACKTKRDESKQGEFGVSHGGITYRAAVLNATSEEVFVLRRFPDQVPPVEKLGINGKIIEHLLTPRLTGLVCISGSFGQGKTTTASSILTARLAQFGGVAITIEDPPEMPLAGRHGEGVCYQTWVQQGGFGQACRQFARWSPTMIFLGEIRDPETATEALRASINGRLVICTTHAEDARTTVERLFTLANGTAGNSDDVSSLLSQGLAAILHQRLEGVAQRFDDAPARRPVVEFLFLRGARDNIGAKNIIKARKFDQLSSEITAQRNEIALSSAGAR